MSELHYLIIPRSANCIAYNMCVYMRPPLPCDIRWHHRDVRRQTQFSTIDSRYCAM